MGVQLTQKTFREKISFKRLQKTGIVCADLMSRGRVFQSRLPAAVKARSPTVTSMVVGMMTSSDDDDRRRRWSNSVTRRTCTTRNDIDVYENAVNAENVYRVFRLLII